VHITDPQYGMHNMYGPDPENWAAEADMFAALAAKAVELSPRPDVVLLGGDMQNFWPNEPGGIGRNRNGHLADEQLLALDLGERQSKHAAEVKAFIEGQGIPVVCTPGNHDLGDVPDLGTIAKYRGRWGPLHQVAAETPAALLLALNSQCYFDSSTPELQRCKEEQNSWLREQLDARVSDSTRLLVLLTHIPPFMAEVEEEHGWSNWRVEDRKEVLDILAGSLRGRPQPASMLWVCGHFHANVASSSSYRSVPVEIRVTGAAGTTMQWGGKLHFGGREAQAVASKAIERAFSEDILGCHKEEALANMQQRLRPLPSRSGFRLVDIGPDGGFKDRYFTLDEPVGALLA